MDARYEGPTLSRFLSEDPALITPQSGQSLNDLLTDPQKMNFYSYVEVRRLRIFGQWDKLKADRSKGA
jgi:hypothetical protein